MKPINEIPEIEQIKATCWGCGKEFRVNIRKSDGKIMTKCFYSKINEQIFTFWNYEFISWDAIDDLKLEIVFKSTFWKIVGFCKLSREIIYFIWKIFNNKKTDYWECSECCKE